MADRGTGSFPKFLKDSMDAAGDVPLGTSREIGRFTGRVLAKCHGVLRHGGCYYQCIYCKDVFHDLDGDGNETGLISVNETGLSSVKRKEFESHLVQYHGVRIVSGFRAFLRRKKKKTLQKERDSSQ